MMSAYVNAPVELADVGPLLSQLEALGIVEDVQMIRIAEHIEHVAAIGNGGSVITGTAQVMTMPPAANSTPKARRPRVVKLDESPLQVAPTPMPDNVVRGLFPPLHGPGDETAPVGDPEEPATATTDSMPTTTVAAGSSPTVTIEEVRKFCAETTQADGSRRSILTAVLREYDAKSLSTIPQDRLPEFYTRIQKEFA